VSILTLRMDAWSDARQLADHLGLWVFRGQKDASWGLSTSIQRAGQQSGSSNVLLSRIEEQMIHEFQRRAHHFLSDPPAQAHRLEWLTIIQHYGGPTRLLDFTRSFYVAAFFAVETASEECAVWCVNTYALHRQVEKALGKDITTNLPHWEVSHRLASLAEPLIGNTSVDPLVLDVEPFRLHQRLAVQQGLFLMPVSVDLPFMQSLAETFGLQAMDFEKSEVKDYDPQIHRKNALGGALVIKLLLPPKTHHDALADLWNMNVTAASLFPGLDGFARSLHYYCRIDNTWWIKTNELLSSKGNA